MDKNSCVCKTIGDLICLGFYIKNNLNRNWTFLGEYQYDNKKYEIYTYQFQGTGVYIKCDNEILFIGIIDDEYIPYINGPIRNNVYLHINKYKNMNVGEIPYDLSEIDKDNIIFESNVELDYYYYSSSVYDNLNDCSTWGYEKKRYDINRKDYLDEKIKECNCLDLFNGIFSPEIILNFIEEVYSNIEDIDMNNQIDEIINSLDDKGLLLLKERINALVDEKELVRKR